MMRPNGKTYIVEMTVRTEVTYFEPENMNPETAEEDALARLNMGSVEVISTTVIDAERQARR